MEVTVNGVVLDGERIHRHTVRHGRDRGNPLLLLLRLLWLQAGAD